jgi:DNA (cytosine-5)-methyltransferase 1
MAYRIIDLFSGAGGLSAGFLYQTENDNFESILAIDNDKAAAATFNSNFGDHCIAVNVEEWLTCNVVPQADLVIGGPPCQGFSLLNKNRGGDSRRALWEPYMDIVEKSNASVFVMENVQGLLKSEEFQDILNKAKDLGFDVNYQLLNTADYGVPQTRKRAIIIGTKEHYIPTSMKPVFPPEPTHSKPGKDTNLPSWRNVYDAIGDLPEPVGTAIRTEHITPLNLHFGRNPTELSMKRYRVVPPGGNRFDLQANAPELTPNCWLRKPSGGTDLFGRLWWDRPSVTIRTEFFKPEKGRYLHPTKHRPITHREAARLMSFPDSFIFNGSKTEIARQIGNAVPPVFAKHIAQHVFDLLNMKVQ